MGAKGFADFDKIMANMGPDQMSILVWAGLLHKFPKIKLEEVDDIIDDFIFVEGNTIENLSSIVMDAIQNASVFGKPDKGETPVEMEPKQSSTPTSTT